jgi:hypothetical protein
MDEPQRITGNKYTVSLNKKSYPVRDNPNSLDLIEFRIDAVLSVMCGRTFETLSFSYDLDTHILRVLSPLEDIIITYISTSEYRNQKLNNILDNDSNK